MSQKVTKNKRVIEKLHHFICGECKKWWSIGDAPAKKNLWYCPWCGIVNEYKKRHKNRK